MTGCDADISSIIGDVTNKEEAEDVSADAEALTDASAEGESSAEEGASTEGNAEADYGVYDELIAKIKEGVEKKDLNLAELDLSENTVLANGAEESAYKDVYGYIMKDLDKDGTKELILGANSYIDGTNVPLGSYDSIVYDIFTIKDGKLAHVLKLGEKERYFLGADDAIVKEQGGEAASLPPVEVIGSFYKVAGDKLELVDGIRCEFDGEGPAYYYSTKDPYKDTSSKITFEKYDEIIADRCSEFVEFTKFVEPPKADKKVTVYTQETSLGYWEIDYLVDREKKYIKLYDDNTGEIELLSNGDGGYYKFTYDDNKIHVTGWINNPDAGVGDKIDGIEYEYKIEGNTLKFKDEEGEWSDFVKEEN